MYYSQSAPLIIYCPNTFGTPTAKTADGILRYGKNPVVALVDPDQAGKNARDVISGSKDVPIVDSLASALKFKPKAMVLGTAPMGGQVPAAWIADITYALQNGLDIISGLHDFLSDNVELANLAKKHHCQLIDVRKPPDNTPVASGCAVEVPAYVMLTVGSSSSVGKMTASVELALAMEKRGFHTKFQATGQTGIMVEGHGIVIDRVIGDFMAGAAEQLVVEAGFSHDFVFIEGQGSINHPSYSGVTLALLHGSAPHGMILCHRAYQSVIEDLPQFAIPPLPELIKLYESNASCVRPAKVCGIVLNTYHLDEVSAKAAILATYEETGLPTNDPVRFGSDNLIDAILKHQEQIS